MADGKVIETDRRIDELLIDMERYGSVVVTRDGQPVARLVPEVDSGAGPEPSEQNLVEQIRTFRESLGDRTFSITELLEMRDEDLR